MPGHLTVPHFLLLLLIILAGARIFAALAKAIGQPAVLGELLAGVVLGGSVLGLVDPKIEMLHLLAELGVVILLFEIGLETDLQKLLKVGGASSAVALVGVAAPFAMGFAVCKWLGLPNMTAIVAGATLTATSVGITARVLADLGRLQEPESQIVLGAAVIDDILGLIILAVVMGLTQGQELSFWNIARITVVAFGFLGATLVLGNWIIPPLFRLTQSIKLPGTVTIFALILAFGLAFLADYAGSAMIVGAFAAGLLLARTPQMHEIEKGVAHIGHFFVPLFFVSVGAAVNVRAFYPDNPASQRALMIGGLLIVVAVAGKFIAGYAPFWFKGRKDVIGVGMSPRGEVGLIFAQMGLASKVFDEALFSAVALMVMVTTFIAPPLLKILFPPKRMDSPPQHEGIEDLVS